MRIFFFLSLLLASFFLWKFSEKAGGLENLFSHQKSSSSFLPTLYTTKKRAFVIVIVARNYGAFLEKTISSCFEQNYEPFRILFIDDASDDGSFSLLSGFSSPKLQIISHEKEEGFSFSWKEALQHCLDEEIVVILEPKDWLAHPWVLQRLNHYYENPNLWLTSGGFLSYPRYEKIEISSFAPLRTGYTLFFREEGIDQAFLKYSSHVGWIDEIFYISNDE